MADRLDTVMTKEDVLASFECALHSPGVEKSGNILADELKKRAARYVSTDRVGLVKAVDEWLESRDGILATQAAVLIRDFRLVELREATQRVRDEVARGTFTSPTAVWLFDDALKSLS
jgi:hypothetical protein